MVTHQSNLPKNSLFEVCTVVKPNDNNCVVHVMNPSDTIRKLKRGTVIAEAEPVTVVDSLSDDLSARPNNNQFRDLQPHLKSLYHETCEREQLDQPTHIGLKQLLIRYADVFAKDNHDLGMTSIVQQEINTGTAPTICQPTRRVPITLQSELDNHIKDVN